MVGRESPRLFIRQTGVILDSFSCSTAHAPQWASPAGLTSKKMFSELIGPRPSPHIWPSPSYNLVHLFTWIIATVTIALSLSFSRGLFSKHWLERSFYFIF